MRRSSALPLPPTTNVISDSSIDVFMCIAFVLTRIELDIVKIEGLDASLSPQELFQVLPLFDVDFTRRFVASEKLALNIII